jgi:hypothetical protein
METYFKGSILDPNKRLLFLDEETPIAMTPEQPTGLIKELHAASAYEKQLAWKLYGQRKVCLKTNPRISIYHTHHLYLYFHSLNKRLSN